MNNAGLGIVGPALEVEPETVIHQMKLSVVGPLLLVQAVYPHMPKNGRIINVGTVASKLGMPTMPIYAAGKAASDALTFALSQEVRWWWRQFLPFFFSSLFCSCAAFALTCLSLPHLTDVVWLSMQIGRDGKQITINTVAPGPVLTDSVPAGYEDGPLIKYLRDRTRAEDRFGTVEDIADAVLLIASERSRWITGQFISVSGGITGN